MSANLPDRLAELLDLALTGPTPFVLMRDADVSGVSGTGEVAEGAYFSVAAGSTAVTRWRGAKGSTTAWDHARFVEEIHGHGGSTRVKVIPLPAMAAALLAIASLGEQPGFDQWSTGWNQALLAVGKLIEGALSPEGSGEAAEDARPTERTPVK
ncbi:hypothetical protein ACIRBX_25000 [Kitasatospora sp. NPDC096147]|uniref:hypothetical protein n=1 Tax=Kitasatospora sp. NPDC096147 TaxID=3364093 RepID=UPI0038132901